MAELQVVADRCPGQWVKFSGRQMSAELREYLSHSTSPSTTKEKKGKIEHLRWYNPPGLVYQIRFVLENDQTVITPKETIYIARAVYATF
jgi:hypothetical protein